MSDNKPESKTPAKAKATTALVRAVHGPMRHLYRDEVFTTDAKKTEIDSFVQVQIDAGKLELVTE